MTVEFELQEQRGLTAKLEDSLQQANARAGGLEEEIRRLTVVNDGLNASHSQLESTLKAERLRGRKRRERSLFWPGEGESDDDYIGARKRLEAESQGKLPLSPHYEKIQPYRSRDIGTQRRKKHMDGGMTANGDFYDASGLVGTLSRKAFPEVVTTAAVDGSHSCENTAPTPQRQRSATALSRSEHLPTPGAAEPEPESASPTAHEKQRMQHLQRLNAAAAPISNSSSQQPHDDDLVAASGSAAGLLGAADAASEADGDRRMRRQATKEIIAELNNRLNNPQATAEVQAPASPLVPKKVAEETASSSSTFARAATSLSNHGGDTGHAAAPPEAPGCCSSAVLSTAIAPRQYASENDWLAAADSWLMRDAARSDSPSWRQEQRTGLHATWRQQRLEEEEAEETEEEEAGQNSSRVRRARDFHRRRCENLASQAAELRNALHANMPVNLATQWMCADRIPKAYANGATDTRQKRHWL